MAGAHSGRITLIPKPEWFGHFGEGPFGVTESVTSPYNLGTIYVWHNIYLHLVDFDGQLVGKYTIPLEVNHHLKKITIFKTWWFLLDDDKMTINPYKNKWCFRKPNRTKKMVVFYVRLPGMASTISSSRSSAACMKGSWNTFTTFGDLEGFFTPPKKHRGFEQKKHRCVMWGAFKTLGWHSIILIG